MNSNLTYLKPSFSPDAADFNVNGFFAKTGVGRGNCFAAAMLDCSGPEGYKRQPGDKSGMPPIVGKVNGKSCPALVSRVINDDPDRLYLADPSEQCAAGHYKVMMFAGESPNGSSDYHWYREVRNVRTRAKSVESVSTVAKRFGVSPSQVQALRNPVQPGDVVRIFNARLWTHKAGLTPQKLEDSCGKLIKDPRAACRKSGDLEYKTLCSTMCVKRPHLT